MSSIEPAHVAHELITYNRGAGTSRLVAAVALMRSGKTGPAPIVVKFTQTTADEMQRELDKQLPPVTPKSSRPLVVSLANLDTVTRVKGHAPRPVLFDTDAVMLLVNKVFSLHRQVEARDKELQAANAQIANLRFRINQLDTLFSLQGAQHRNEVRDLTRYRGALMAVQHLLSHSERHKVRNLRRKLATTLHYALRDWSKRPPKT